MKGKSKEPGCIWYRQADCSREAWELITAADRLGEWDFQTERPEWVTKKVCIVGEAVKIAEE